MKKQNYEIRNEKIKVAFTTLKREHPERLAKPLNLSWSNWGFGTESLESSLERLKRNGLNYVELQGNHFTPDSGYQAKETRVLLDKYDIKVSGVCGMFSEESDLSGRDLGVREAALDYIKREIDFLKAVEGRYLLVVPGAVGRPQAVDEKEFTRSAETLRRAGAFFEEARISCAVEPIRSEEVSLVHSIVQASAYIKEVNHTGISHINGDVFHMQGGETHIGEAILEAGEQLINLHLADSNRGALGMGMMDIDTIIMALYLIGHNREGRFVTPEPLGSGSNPYEALTGKADPGKLDRLVSQTVSYFREREQIVKKEI